MSNFDLIDRNSVRGRGEIPYLIDVVGSELSLSRCDGDQFHVISVIVQTSTPATGLGSEKGRETVY